MKDDSKVLEENDSVSFETRQGPEDPEAENLTLRAVLLFSFQYQNI